PLGTRLLVKCLRTGKSVIVLINDRGPWNDKFQLDLSEGAARAIGITKRLGWGWVEVHQKMNDTETKEVTTQEERSCWVCEGSGRTQLNGTKKNPGCFPVYTDCWKCGGTGKITN